MPSMVWVVDSAARQTKVKVTPGTYMRDVLEEACKSKKLNPAQYTLKTQNNKAVDLSQPFRLSGLSPGAKLQLTQASRSPSVVSVKLTVPEEGEGGTSLVDRFPSNTSLWQILRRFEAGVAGGQQKLNLTQRGVASTESGAGMMMYNSPSLNVGGRSVEGFTELQKTLAQLGYNSGSVVIRVGFKNSGQPLHEAMQAMSAYFDSVEAESVAAGSSETATVPTEATAGKEAIEDAPPTDEPAASAAESDVQAPSEVNVGSQLPSPSHASTTVNGITVYRPSSNSTPAAALQQHDESLYEPTVDHAKAHQANLKDAGRNKRLLSDKELEEQEANRQARLAAVQSVTVRIRYPDQHMTEFSISPTTTPADLYDKVTFTVAADNEPFELRYMGTTGSRLLTRTNTERLVKDHGFRANVLVNMVWSPQASLDARQKPTLKAEYLSHATELKPTFTDTETQHVTEEHVKAPEKEAAMENKGKSAGDREAKLKKLLGFGKK
jgi:tether containing UBX domain for GLUT4